jgi:hypothetical protein
MDHRRLNQARGGSAEAEANAISMYNAIFLFVLFLVEGSSVHQAGLCSLAIFLELESERASCSMQLHSLCSMALDAVEAVGPRSCTVPDK